MGAGAGIEPPIASPGAGVGAGGGAAASPGPATAAIEELGKMAGLTPAAILGRSTAELEQLLEDNGIVTRALKKRAKEIGIINAELEKAAAGANTWGAVLELVLAAAKAEAAGAPGRESLRAELAGLTVMALEDRAEELGVDEAKLDAASDATNSKEAITALILDKLHPEEVDEPDDRFEDRGPAPGAADKPLRQGTLTADLGSEEVVAKKHADEESFRAEWDNLKEAQKDQGKALVVNLKGVHEPTGMIYLGLITCSGCSSSSALSAWEKVQSTPSL